ncbi:MAG: histidine--tRNA ligase [Candidatus Aadella gelida]|nr:histidine--tRNA ligase [Candidatus Aadella gelida]
MKKKSKNNTYRSLRGMPDILPQEAGAFYMVEKSARKVFRMFGFTEIRTPILEETVLFTRSIGEDTDIVEKEMYSLKDRSEKEISLRPEGTASVIRAFIERGLDKENNISKLFYIGPMFRSERPQKGRLRQFHQIGAEMIGVPKGSICYDVELITNAMSVIDSAGIEKAELNINSLGCSDDREKYKKMLKEALLKKKDELCENCQRRTSSNVLRVLDCKNKECKHIIAAAPKVSDSLCEECSSNYCGVKDNLKKLGVKFKENHNLVRGLDYYTGMVFEINHPSLGAQDAIAAGGRYDDLAGEMGGPDVGAIGYALGIERALLAVSDEKKPVIVKGVLVIVLGEENLTEALRTVQKFREHDISCEIEVTTSSLKSIMKRANKEKREKVIIIGDQEVNKGVVLFKDMETGDQEELTIGECVEKIKSQRVRESG